MTSINYDTMDDPETFVPRHMRGSYKRYFEQGLDAGSFGMAVINLNPHKAKCLADVVNSQHIETQIEWVKRHAPKTKGE